jgi:very-short-patch-repair endonuclease
VAVEFDSFQWHNDRFTFVKDRRKDRLFKREGIELIRVVDEDLGESLLALVAELVQTITRRTVERELAS